MKIVRTLLLPALLLLFYSMPAALAQDEPSAAWQITKFDVTINSAPSERALSARAVLTVRNIGAGSGKSITLRINPKAEVKAVSVAEATAVFRAGEVRNELQLIRTTLPAAVAPGASVNISIDYRLPITENTGLSALSPVGSQFLPLSFWYPMHNVPASLNGADYAPFRLTINGAGGEMSVTSGKASGASFEQTLNAQPFFVSGSWDVSEGTGETKGISVLLPKGAGADERKRADEMMALAAGARTFYASLLGAAPDAPIRLVAIKRGAGFNDAGTILLDAAAFRRSKIDALTAMAISESIARLWVGGITPVRGEGGGVIREGLPKYLAALFLEKQFGRETADAEKARERVAYAAIAKRDGPLSRTTPLDPTYFNASANKGAMIWRLTERALGRDSLLAVLRSALQMGASQPGGLTLAALRTQLAEKGGANLKALLDQQLDQPTEMDLMIGLPQQKGAQWAAALRNTGAVDANVTVAATTATGERLSVQATVPARNFGEAVFNTSARLARVEIDPDKLYPQLDYSNDIAPRPSQVEDPLVEATAKFIKQDYAGAEAAARALLSDSPRSQEGRILLARSLLAQNKMDEAEKEFRAALDEKLPTPTTLAWGNIGLAETALRKGQTPEAVQRYSEAIRADAEYASTLNARLGRIKAEAAANAAPAPDESARAFIAQLDLAIKGGRKAELDQLIVPGELTNFVRGIVGSQPELWQTRVIRTEALDANRLAADVILNTKELGREQSGTAVLILQRMGGGWKLAGIEFFEVR